MNGLRSDYLNKLAKTCLLDFKSVTACDLLEDLKSGEKYICNLDPSFKPGSHYVCFSIEEKTVIFFDPYGQPCYNDYMLKAFSESQLSEMKYSKKCIQNDVSLFCGYFCLSQLICYEQGVSLEKFVSQFDDKDVLKNENIAINIIKDRLASLQM